MDDSIDYPNDSNDLAELSISQINDISDFYQGLDLLDERNLLLKYINNLDDVKEVLRLKYHSKPENNEITRHQELYLNYPIFMKKLNVLLNNLKEFVELQDFKREIGEIYKISESQMGSRIEELEKMILKDKFPILTAGEAKAGKSTFINLLLGTNLLPMDLVTCTRIICEIKNSDEKTVTFTAKGKEPIIKSLSLDENKQISDIVRQDTHVGYTKAIYKYPVKFLENYTYLVDSPGIGDSFFLESMTFDYLSNSAPAFIFVLNATNSNGLNIKARQLIEKAKKDLTEDTNKYITDLTNKNQVQEYYFQYHKAIFILNHWDTVKGNAKSKEEVEEVRKVIIAEIKLLWHDSVEENEQIFFISARQANEWQASGIVQTEIINIRNCIRKLVVNLYQKNVENSLELLNLILNNMEKKILQKINTIVDNKYCRLYDKRNAEHLCNILENLIKEMDSRKTKIRGQLKPKFETMAELLTQHLKSEAVENRILNITKPQITVNDNMDLLTIVFRKLLETKLYEEIKLWEEETKQMESLYSFLNGLFEENLIQISNEIKISNNLINKESLIKAWNSTNQCEVTNFDKDFITKIEKVFIISTITLLFPVVALAGLLATPLIMTHIVREKKNNEEKLAAYKADPEKYLRKLISSSLQRLSSADVKNSFFNNVQRKCEDHIKAFDTFITIEINEKQQLIKDIEKETRAIPEILRSLSSLYYKIEKCYGEYHNLRNSSEHARDQCLIVRPSTYSYLLETDSMITECIATGKHSIIFKNSHYPSLIFKNYNKKFHHENARFQMQEIDLLVKAPDNYILRCKNICIMNKEEKVLLVLDNVDCNLHDYVLHNPQLILGKQDRNTDSWKKALLFIIDVSIKLCRGIRYLHTYDPRMVHPDLRLDTILVRKSDITGKIQIFICDACTNLPTQRCQKKSGNNLKETPEDSFDMGGYTKENIHRLGAIFYKLAHFEAEKITIAPKTSFVSISSLFDDIKSVESLESDMKINWEEGKHDGIPHRYNTLIKDCLSTKPENRPTIDECINILKEIKGAKHN